MRVPRSILIAALLIATAPFGGQTTPGASAFQNQFPDPLSYRPPVPDAPELQILSVTQIDLPGPLQSGPVLVDGRIEILTADGLARTAWTAAAVTIEPEARPTWVADEELDWAVSADGSHRAKPVNERVLLVQKTCDSCTSGWRRRWRLRVAGLAQVAPIVTKRRIYYGAADNQVYGVRRKNGHRAWATPLDGQVIRPLGLWVDADVAALLVVPEPGAEVVVLDALGGRQVFRYRLPDEGDRVLGTPLATPDGRIVLARQGYADSDAGLIVLEIGYQAPKQEDPDDSPTTGYNPPTSKEVAPAPPVQGVRAADEAPGVPQ